jgi:hypothetical protein
MVESYDAADPERASTLALRDEWMDEGRSTQVRIAGGYGDLIVNRLANLTPRIASPEDVTFA